LPLLLTLVQLAGAASAASVWFHCHPRPRGETCRHHCHRSAPLPPQPSQRHSLRPQATGTQAAGEKLGDTVRGGWAKRGRCSGKPPANQVLFFVNHHGTAVSRKRREREFVVLSYCRIVGRRGRWRGTKVVLQYRVRTRVLARAASSGSSPVCRALRATTSTPTPNNPQRAQLVVTNTFSEATQQQASK
jgi:hypothetical protein